ncbi:MAG: ATP-binding protein [Peptostreptococcales bacterium]
MVGMSRWMSIKWKIIFTYFVLVFIAMTIVSVFIIQQLEAHYLNKVKTDMTRLAENMGTIERYDDITLRQGEIQSDILAWGKGIEEEITIVNEDFLVIASTNENLVHKNAMERLDVDLIRDGFIGIRGSKEDISGEQGIQTMNMVFPIKDGGKVHGVFYIRSDLTGIYETIDRSKAIFINATLLALLVTIVLGFLIAKSITGPINDVREKASKMAKGDFSQSVSVKSDDEIGRLAEMFNYLTDKLNLTLSEISKENSKLETILTNMADGLIAVGIDGYIIHINPMAKTMLHVADEDIEKNKYDDIISEFNEKLTLKYIKNHMAVWEGTEDFEYNHSFFTAQYAPFTDENDNNIGIVMIIHDITERQKLENMQKEFVANVSHELKTPLTSIKSYTETLLEGALSDIDVSEQFLKVVDSESDRMTRLVKDLLQLSRLDYQREIWNKVEIDLSFILDIALTKIELTAKQKNQKIHKNYTLSSAMVFADKDRIEQVISNILSNAIKYTQAGGEIHVDLITKEEKAQIIIKDNGMGIPQKDIPRLFDRFYRVDKARSRDLGGTGLGLSIAKQIMTAHAGDILIESVYGEGTSVILILPLG